MPDYWKNVEVASCVCEQLNAAYTPIGGGQLSMKEVPFGDFRFWAIAHLFRFHKEVPEPLREQISRSAALDVRTSRELNPELLGNAIASRQNQYLGRPIQDFILLTALSVKYSDQIPCFLVGDARIDFVPTHPSHFVHEDANRRVKQLTSAPIPSNCCHALVRVRAREPIAAGDAALRQMDILRALWNVFLTHGRLTVSLGGKQKPINVVRVGPIQTVHNPDGTAATHVTWSDPGFTPFDTLHDMGNGIGKLVDGCDKALNAIRKMEMREEYERVVVQFVRALDGGDLQAAFVKLWAVLETVTGTGLENHKVTARRASFLFVKGRVYSQYILDCMREWRNRMVHQGDDANAELMVQYLRMYVEEIMLYILERAGDFKNLYEFGQFLDLPTNPDELEKRIKRFTEARDIQKPT